jgi:hypothetical protein
VASGSRAAREVLAKGTHNRSVNLPTGGQAIARPSASSVPEVSMALADVLTWSLFRQILGCIERSRGIKPVRAINAQEADQNT